MYGSSIRLGRLFDRESQRSFMVAFDRTLSLGPEPYAENSGEAIRRIAAHGADAILMSPGLLKQHGSLLGYRGAPGIVCRIDFPFVGAADRGHSEQFRLIASVEEAAALGADAVVMFHTLGYAEKEPWADNIAAIGHVAEQARRIGLPLIVEAVPWGSEVDDPRTPELVAQAARIAAELGADAIKTEFVGSAESMRVIVESCPVPVLVLGGPRVGLEELLSFTGDALAAGVAGVIYGRNVWQRDDAAVVSAELARVVHERKDDDR
jgi:DhnA family fructose-bisphosphate aldolase class Ia